MCRTSSTATSRTTRKAEIEGCEGGGFPLYSDPPPAPKLARRNDGAIAQLGERFNGIEEVVGSIPSGSTSLTHCFYSVFGFYNTSRDIRALAVHSAQHTTSETRKTETPSAILPAVSEREKSFSDVGQPRFIGDWFDTCRDWFDSDIADANHRWPIRAPIPTCSRDG